MYTHRNLNKVMVSLLIASMVMCSISCDKSDKRGDDGENLPVLSTLPVTGITSNSANLGGNITDSGFPVYTEIGVCYSKRPNPTTNDYKLTLSYGVGGLYEIKATDLSEKTTYYVRAYATNSVGTAYGNQVSFTTLDEGAVPLIYINEGADIIIDLNDLSIFALPVVVTCAKEDLIYVSVYIQGEDGSQYGLDFITMFENPKIWTKTYTAADFNIIELFESISEGTTWIFKVIVTTADGQFAANAPIEIIGSITHPLEGPEDFTWERIGSSPGTGLDEFGLQWQSNTAEYIVITPSEGTKLVELNVNDWNIETKEELVELVENGTALAKWEVIPTKVTFNYVIATKTKDGKYFLINPTERMIDPNDIGLRIVTGQYKY